MTAGRRWLVAFVIIAIAVGTGFAARRWMRTRPRSTALPSTALEIDGQAPRFTRLAAAASGGGVAACDTGVTGPRAVVEVLGNPAAMRYPACDQAYARNPWDLAVHGGRLYIGLGDSGNEGPSANAGPVPVYAYDLATGRFLQETTLDDEQIDRFYVHGTELWIPGDDPRASWDLGNLYVRQSSGQWTEQRTIPNGIHAHALAWQEGRLYAGLTVGHADPPAPGNGPWGSAVAASTDGGATWTVTPLGGMRAFEFLQVKGKLHAVDVMPGPGVRQWLAARGRLVGYAILHELTPSGTFRRRPDVAPAALLPDTPLAGNRAAHLERAVRWGEAAAFVAAFAPARGDAPVRAGYVARNLEEGRVDVERLPLPGDALAMSLGTQGVILEALVATPLMGGRWRSEVLGSADGMNWKTSACVDAPGPARSFVHVGGDVVLGLGVLGPLEPGPCTVEQEISGVLVRLRGVPTARSSSPE